MRWTLVVGLASSLLLAAAPAARAETTSEAQAWASFVMNARVTGDKPASPGLSAWLDVQTRRAPDRTTILYRPGIGYRLSSLLSAWLGYAWVGTAFDSAAPANEHRVWEQGFMQGQAGILRYQVRPRLEQRFRDGQSDVGHRFRIFGRANLRFMDDPTLDVALWNELFVGFNETKWGQPAGFDQNRAFVGLGWTLGQVRLEPGYTNIVVQRPNGSWVIQHVGALWGFLTF